MSDPIGVLANERLTCQEMWYDLPCARSRWRGTLTLSYGLAGGFPIDSVWILTMCSLVAGGLAVFAGLHEDLVILSVIIGLAVGLFLAGCPRRMWKMNQDYIWYQSMWSNRSWNASDLRDVQVVDQSFYVTYEANGRSQPYSVFGNQALLIGKGILLHFANGEVVDMGGSADSKSVHRVARDIEKMYGLGDDDPDHPMSEPSERENRWLILLGLSFFVPFAIALIVIILAEAGI